MIDIVQKKEIVGKDMGSMAIPDDKKGPAPAGPIEVENGLQQTDLLVVARRPIVDGQAGQIQIGRAHV